MEPPQGKLTAEEWNSRFEHEKHKRYVVNKQTGYWCCRNCLEDVVAIGIRVDVHIGRMCVETGQKFTFPIPFCEACEGPPKIRRSCVHTKEESNWLQKQKPTVH